MQEQVMEAMYPDENDEPTIFGFACSMLYFGNLIFRLGHNVVFGFAIPRTRVVRNKQKPTKFYFHHFDFSSFNQFISMLAMAASMGTIFSIFIWFRSSQYIWLVFIGYGLGGVAVGWYL